MNATDLMLGDYVQIENDESTLFTDYICEIGYVPQWNELGVKTSECGDEWLRESEIMSLPLTPEIFEKNGFILKEKETSMYGVNIAPYYTRDDVPFEVFCDGKPFAIWFKDPVNIRYVHELQHALKLCGINKEIVL